MSHDFHKKLSQVIARQYSDYPKAVKDWMHAHPELLLDEEANKRLQAAAAQCINEGFSVHRPGFVERLNRKLGFAR